MTACSTPRSATWVPGLAEEFGWEAVGRRDDTVSGRTSDPSSIAIPTGRRSATRSSPASPSAAIRPVARSSTRARPTRRPAGRAHDRHLDTGRPQLRDHGPVGGPTKRWSTWQRRGTSSATAISAGRSRSESRMKRAGDDGAARCALRVSGCRRGRFRPEARGRRDALSPPCRWRRRSEPPRASTLAAPLAQEDRQHGERSHREELRCQF